MLVTPPGHARSWVEMLPAPWDQNPFVVVVLAPREAKYQVRKLGKVQYGCLAVGERTYGLQVLDKPNCATYAEQDVEFHKVGCPMAMPAYIGPLEDVRPRLLTTVDFMPLLFQGEKMSSPYLNLRNYMRAHSTKE